MMFVDWLLAISDASRMDERGRFSAFEGAKIFSEVLGMDRGETSLLVPNECMVKILPMVPIAS